MDTTGKVTLFALLAFLALPVYAATSASDSASSKQELTTSGAKQGAMAHQGEKAHHLISHKDGHHRHHHCRYYNGNHEYHHCHCYKHHHKHHHHHQ